MPVNIYRAKTVILGNPGVGKSAVVQMFFSEGREFSKNYNMTLGVELYAKREAVSDSEAVEMILYDCGGLDIYVDSLTQFWDQPDLLVIVYDVCSTASLQSVADWHRVALAAEWAGGRATPLAGVLLANKTDVAQRRMVTTEQGQQLATKLGLHYVEGSAKNNVGVRDAFSWLAAQFHSTQKAVRPSYSSLHKSVLRSSLSNSSLK